MLVCTVSGCIKGGEEQILTLVLVLNRGATTNSRDKIAKEKGKSLSSRVQDVGDRSCRASGSSLLELAMIAREHSKNLPKQRFQC